MFIESKESNYKKFPNKTLVNALLVDLRPYETLYFTSKGPGMGWGTGVVGVREPCLGSLERKRFVEPSKNTCRFQLLVMENKTTTFTILHGP